MAHRRARPSRRMLGVDLGERWVGVAGTDDTGVLASPIVTLDLKRSAISDIARIAAERNMGGIVVGLPKTMGGAEGFQAKRARTQAEELRACTCLPVVFWDERLTTAMAEEIAERRTRRAKKRNEKADALAAAVLLQSYIDARPYQPRKPKVDS